MGNSSAFLRRTILQPEGSGKGHHLSPATATTCHCEARSAEAISCLTIRGTLVRQGIASPLRASQ